MMPGIIQRTSYTWIHSTLITILCCRFYHNSLNLWGTDYKTHHYFVNWTLKCHLYFINGNFEIMKGLATCPRRLVLIIVEPRCTLGRVRPQPMLLAILSTPERCLHFSNQIQPSQEISAGMWRHRINNATLDITIL